MRAGEALIDIKANNMLGGELGKIGKQFDQFANKLAVGIGAAFAAIGLALRRSLGQADALDKVTKSLNITSEAYTAMAYAASQVGVTTEDLNTSLSKMSVNLGKAITDGGKAAGAFSQLGLKANELANMPIEEAFKKIADALNQVDNQFVKASMAAEVFGKGFKSIMPLLAEGSSGMAKLAEEARKMGLIIEGDVTAKAAAAEDEYNKLGKVWDALIIKINAALLPAYIALRNIMVDVANWVTVNKDWIIVLGVEFVKLGAIVLGLIAIWKTYRAIVVAVTSAKVMLLAVSGPGGWAILAGAVVAAGLAYAYLSQSIANANSQMSSMNVTAAKTKTNMSIPGLGGGAGSKGGGGGLKIESASEMWRRMSTAASSTPTPVNVMNWNAMPLAGGGPGFTPSGIPSTPGMQPGGSFLPGIKGLTGKESIAQKTAAGQPTSTYNSNMSSLERLWMKIGYALQTNTTNPSKGLSYWDDGFASKAQ